MSTGIPVLIYYFDLKLKQRFDNMAFTVRRNTKVFANIMFLRQLLFLRTNDRVSVCSYTHLTTTYSAPSDDGKCLVWNDDAGYDIRGYHSGK